MLYQFYLLKEPAFSFIDLYYCFLCFFRLLVLHMGQPRAHTLALQREVSRFLTMYILLC